MANFKKKPKPIVDLNFKVPASFRKKFKVAAAKYDVTMQELLKVIFRLWRQTARRSGGSAKLQR